MRIREIWRFPVKSLQGEQLDVAEVGPDGIAGDRRLAVFDLDTGFGLTARREPRLLAAAATWQAGRVSIRLPDGATAEDDAALSAWLGRRVTLRRADEPGPRRYENPADPENEADWITWNGPRGPFHDAAQNRVSLVSTGSLGPWEVRRFRANLVLDGAGDEHLVGSRVRVGTAVLEVTKPIPRCVMVTRAQPGGIARDLEVLRTINRTRGGTLGVGALVVEPGVVRVGDPVEPL
ncbi:MAG: sulfurase [Chloroflexota bacterium]